MEKEGDKELVDKCRGDKPPLRGWLDVISLGVRILYKYIIKNQRDKKNVLYPNHKY